MIVECQGDRVENGCGGGNSGGRYVEDEVIADIDASINDDTDDIKNWKMWI